jgi:DNA gyrase subunit B
VNDIDAVRKRPGMYVGDTQDGTGLHCMVRELASNAMNEALAGYGDRVDVTLNPDGSCTVRDKGRGIPVDLCPGGSRFQGTSAAEVIMTRLARAVKFEQSHEAPRVQSRPGVGAAVVNGLSERLELRIWREGSEHFMQFRAGQPDAPLKVVGDAGREDGAPRRGTEISFLPDARLFSSIKFDFGVIEDMLRSFMLPGSRCRIVLTDRRGPEIKQVVIAND